MKEECDVDGEDGELKRQVMTKKENNEKITER